MSATQKILQKTVSFSDLDDQALDALLESAREVSLAAGELLFQEGDPGDAMYLILEGDIQIYKNRPAGDVVLVRLAAGQTFGELALLPGRSGRRTANARALSPALLYRIEKAAFQQLLGADHPLKEKLAAIGDRQLLNDLTKESRLFRALQLADEPQQEMKFTKGQTIFKQGDRPDFLYVVLEGKVAIFQERGSERDHRATLDQGMCFGELGLVQQAPRSATAEAATDCRLMAVPFSRYGAGQNMAPELAELFGTMKRAYKLPRKGRMVQSSGTFAGRETVNSLYELDDGRKVMTSRVVGGDVYNADEIFAAGAPAAPRTLLYIGEGGQVRRELRFDEGDILIGMGVQGTWPTLAELQRRLLDRTPIPAGLLERFAETGDVQFSEDTSPDSVVCSCVNAERRQVTEAINAGATSFELLQRQTGCGTACGSCVPNLKQMLGNEAWSPVQVADERQVTSEIRRFRLRPIGRTVEQFKPGQHVVISGLVRGDWLQRAYTLTSACTEPDHYEVVVKREPRGMFSGWLFDEAGEDALLRMSPPRGEYFWEPSGTPVVCLTAGIGVTPALAILRSKQREQWTEALHLDCSVRHPMEMVGAEDFRVASESDAAITARWRVTTTEGRIGQADVDALHARFAGAEYFLCGPDVYMDSVKQLLTKAGVKEGRIRIEKFAAASAAPALAATPSAPIAAAPPAASKKALRGWLSNMFGRK